MRDGDPIRCRVCARPVRLRDGYAATSHPRSGPPCPGTGRPPAGDPPCTPACRAIGTIGWPAILRAGEVHASTHVCDSPAHQDEARAWVHGITGHAGVFRTFAEARQEG